MPRIPCRSRRFYRKKIFPFASFVARSPRFFGVVEALVDTGSPFTVLSTVDALKMRMPIKKMRKGDSVSLAGFRFFRYHIKNASFTFKTQDDQPISFDVKDLGILVPTKIDKKTLKDIEPIPSIIGNDFLEDHNLALFFNPSQKITYLETVESTS